MTDPRPMRSREVLIAAITTVLDEPDNGQLSITDLCAVAGVSRPTFYQHFGDIPSLIEAAAIDRMQALFTTGVPAPTEEDWKDAAPRVVRNLLDGLLAHADFYRRVLTGASARSFQERVVAFLTQRLLTFSPLATPPANEADRERLQRFATFLAAGTTWMVVGWLLDDASRPPLADAASGITELLVTGVTSHLHAGSHSDPDL